jgi:hypothetical protein
MTPFDIHTDTMKHGGCDHWQAGKQLLAPGSLVRLLAIWPFSALLEMTHVRQDHVYRKPVSRYVPLFGCTSSLPYKYQVSKIPTFTKITMSDSMWDELSLYLNCVVEKYLKLILSLHFCDVIPCNLVEIYWCFGQTYCLLPQGRQVSPASCDSINWRFQANMTELVEPKQKEEGESKKQRKTSTKNR